MTKKFTKTGKLKESEIQRQILSYLHSEGYFSFKMPLGPLLVRGPKGKLFAAPNKLKGFPDIFGICKKYPGKMFCIEVKSSTGTLSKEQKTWFTALRQVGVPCTIARSVDEVKSFLSLIESKITYPLGANDIIKVITNND